MIELDLSDPRIVWDGVIELETRPDGLIRPLRVRKTDLVGMTDASFLTNAATSTGSRFAVCTDADRLSLGVHSDVVDSSPIDVLVDGRMHQRLALDAGRQTIRVDLPPGNHRVELWMPQYGPVGLHNLTLADAASLSGPPVPKTRWAAYGSSITACRAAAGPSETWPALVATENRWSNLNLGFAGSCHLDPAIAQTIAAYPADIVSVCIGINIYSQLTYNARSLPSAIVGFLSIVRAAHPEAPIAVISPIGCPKWEPTENALGLTLDAVRAIVHDTTHALADSGDRLLFLIDGLEILGLQDSSLLEDGLHPSPAGYRTMAGRLAPRLREIAMPPAAE